MNPEQNKAFGDKVVEIQELTEKVKKWEACADMLFVWADELKCGTHSQAIYEAVCQDIEKYNELKLENS